MQPSGSLHGIDLWVLRPPAPEKGRGKDRRRGRGPDGPVSGFGGLCARERKPAAAGFLSQESVMEWVRVQDRNGCAGAYTRNCPMHTK